MAHRTQIYLDESQYQFLKTLAQTEGKSVAQIIRDWIDARRVRRTTKQYEHDAFFKIRGAFKSGVPDMAERFDEYLYGDEDA